MLRINDYLSLLDNVLIIDRELVDSLDEGDSLGIALTGPQAYRLVTAISLHFVGKPVEDEAPADLCGTGENACSPNCCGGKE